jgi:hypothetical protein
MGKRKLNLCKTVVAIAISFAVMQAQAQSTVAQNLPSELVSASGPGESEPAAQYKLKKLIVDSSRNTVFVLYDKTFASGQTNPRWARLFLDNDRMINYKMAMLSSLKDVLENDALNVSLTVVPPEPNGGTLVSVSISR